MSDYARPVVNVCVRERAITDRWFVHVIYLAFLETLLEIVVTRRLRYLGSALVCIKEITILFVSVMVLFYLCDGM